MEPNTVTSRSRNPATNAMEEWRGVAIREDEKEVHRRGYEPVLLGTKLRVFPTKLELDHGK